MTASRSEPKLKRNKRCLVCNGVRRLTPNPQRGVDPKIYETDPFCSAVCAKKYFGTVEHPGGQYYGR